MHAPILSPSSPLDPPAANRLYVRAGSLGPPPSFYFELQMATSFPPETQTNAETGEQTQTTPPDLVQTLKNGNVSMTAEQWAAWTDQDDDPYILQCAAANLGLTLA